MTKSEIITETRNLVNEISTDTGTKLADAGNLLYWINDAMEHVVLSLLPIMPGQFLTTENVTLIKDQANYTLTNSYWMIWKVEKNVTGGAPTEIRIIDPLEMQDYTTVAETDSEPPACYFFGDTLYFVPTPSAAYTNYAKVYEIRPELADIPTAGPTYIPRPAHRLIVYRAAYMIAKAFECNPEPFKELYYERLKAVTDVWNRRFQQKVRFVRDGVEERGAMDARLSEFNDIGW